MTKIINLENFTGSGTWCRSFLGRYQARRGDIVQGETTKRTSSRTRSLPAADILSVGSEQSSSEPDTKTGQKRKRISNGSENVEITNQLQKRIDELEEKVETENLKVASKNLVNNNKNFGQKSNIWSKIEHLIKNRTFGPKLKIWSKIKNLVKNRKFGQKLKIWSKIKNLVKN